MFISLCIYVYIICMYFRYNFIHTCIFIYRDLKPNNIMMTEGGDYIKVRIYIYIYEHMDLYICGFLCLIIHMYIYVKYLCMSFKNVYGPSGI
jgi:serine/threonine protein kinase